MIHVRQLALSGLKAAQFLLGDKPQEKRQFALESLLQVLISRVLGVRVELSPVEDESIRLYLNQPQLVVAQVPAPSHWELRLDAQGSVFTSPRAKELHDRRQRWVMLSDRVPGPE